ncbi:MAG TPA: DUF4395 family protein [Gemmatimonadaceae bacterium]
MSVTPVVRKRLEVQGFCNLDDATMGELAPWMRWSPAICTCIFAVGVALRSPAVLWGLVPFSLLGALLPFHPFDLVYNHVVRYATGTGPLPRHGAQRRFACSLATAWLIATGAAFATGHTVLGLVLGLSLTAVGALVSFTHICIPSMIYNATLGRRAAAVVGEGAR